MYLSRRPWLFGLALWLGLLTTEANAQFVFPQTQTPVADQGLTPFFVRGNGGVVILNRPGFFGAQQQVTQNIQQFGAGQQGFAQQAGAPGGLPFSTLPPPQYFFNYNPYYPLLRPGIGPLPVGSPRTQ